MKLLEHICLLFILVCFAAAALDAPIPFTVDLGVHPQMRWRGAVEKVVAAHGWEYSLGPFFEYYNKRLWDHVPTSALSLLEGLVKERTPEAYQELKGLASGFNKVGHPEINVTVLAGWTYFYELSHITSANVTQPLACTGILALPEDPNLDIVHGRNLDLYPLSLRNMTLEVNFTKGGEVLYQGLGWSWVTTSFLTSSSKRVTMSGDWRVQPGVYTAEMVLARIMRPGAIPLIFYFRTLQAGQQDISEIVALMSNLTVAAPFYLIMSGTHRRGSIVTVSWNSNDTRVATLDDSSNYWFMVETNHDRWKPNPPSDPRYTVAVNMMKMLGRSRGATPLGVWMTISEFPVHNAGTAYSAIMTVSTSVWGYTRMAMNPVLPWYPPK